MKKTALLFLIFITLNSALIAQQLNKAGVHLIADSIKATAVYTEPLIGSEPTGKMTAWLNVDETSITMRKQKGKKFFSFNDIKYGKIIVTPPQVSLKGRTFRWYHEWQPNEKLFFLVMIAVDSAAKKSLYSAYIGWPDKKQWKLMGTYRLHYTSYLNGFAASYKPKKKTSVNFTNQWLQRSTGSWKALADQTGPSPALRSYSNIDSAAQQQLEESQLRSQLPKDSVQYKEGVFYQLLSPGTGPQVQLTDTVVVHYKGSLFSDGSVFDQTKEKPASFPLNRLIKGWQLGVPQCRVGGKIKLFIPSGLAYGIRTFTPAIPPNSILVFEVEVLEAKPKQ
jgi:FKBP-type peptidyl-prolyl cis-trans isomerase FkpA